MIDRRPVTVALAELLASGTGMPVGRGQMPQADPPYYLLYPVDAVLDGPPLADENPDSEYVYQVTCVSGPDPAHPGSTGDQDQAEWLADKVRRAFLARDASGQWAMPLSLPGLAVMCRELETEPGATNDPKDAIISYVLRFRLSLTPA